MNVILQDPFVLLAPPDHLSHRLTLEGHSVAMCRFNPNGLLLAASTHDGLVLIIDLLTAQITHKLTAHVSRLNSLVFRFLVI